MKIFVLNHSSEIRGLWPSAMLQNLPYFVYTKTQSCSKWKTKKTELGFLIPKILQILKHFAGHFIKHKPLISEEWYSILPNSKNLGNNMFDSTLYDLYDHKVPFMFITSII